MGGVTPAGDVGGGRGDSEPAVAVDGGDRPGVAVGDAEAAVVAAGGDPVADPDALPASGDRHPGVVDPAAGDQPLPDGVVEVGGLVAGVDYYRQTGPRRLLCVVGGGDGGIRLAGQGCGSSVMSREASRPKRPTQGDL
jgi:hypothetical protein